MDIDEDTHVCLRCQTTIIGLDNYINHKKSMCPVSINRQLLNALPSEVDICTYLKNSCAASSKDSWHAPTTCTPQTPTPNTPPNNSTAPVTPEANNASTSTAPVTPEANNASTAYRDDFHLRSDDFFLSLELQCKSQAKTPDHATEKPSWDRDSNINLGFPDFDCNEEDMEDIGTISDFDSVVCDDANLHPPSVHTGGKWKPGSPPSNLHWKSSFSCSPPPPTHTRGKWLPGKRLTSYHSYSTIDHESTRDDQIPQQTSPVARTSPTVRTSVRRRNSEKSKISADHFCNPCGHQCKDQEEFAQHLVSDEHVSKSVDHPTREKMILNKVTPYQCSVCSSYFNSHNLFLEHCQSNEHLVKMSTCRGHFQCTLCNFAVRKSSDIHEHFSSADHNKMLPSVSMFRPLILILQEKNKTVRRLSLRKKKKSIKLQQYECEKWKCFMCNHHTKSRAKLKSHVESVHKLVTKGGRKIPKKPKRVKKPKIVTEEQQATVKIEADTGEAVPDLSQAQEWGDETQSVSPKQKRKFTCLECVLDFSSREELISHFDLHPNKKTCDQCSFATVYNYKLLSHKIIKHHCDSDDKKVDTDNMKKVYLCSLCHYLTPQKSTLESHLVTHTREKPFSCTICGAKFGNRGSLSSHEKMHAPRTDKNKCETCGFKARKPSLLKRHILVKHSTGEIEKPYQCEICQVKFSLRWRLKMHMLVHEGNDKQVECSYDGCPMMFRNKCAMEMHASVHTQEKAHLCDICGHACRTKEQMNRHFRRHSGAKPFSCSLCPFRTSLSSQLSRHKRIHTGSKPYKCPYCKYTCNTQENLRKHVLHTKKHDGKKVYPCKHCDYATNEWLDFHQHSKNQHPGNNIEVPVYHVEQILPENIPVENEEIKAAVDSIDQQN